MQTQSLEAYRKGANFTLEQLAVKLGMAPTNKGRLSRIENGEPAPLRLALKIHALSAGAVPAETLVSPEDRTLLRLVASLRPTASP